MVSNLQDHLGFSLRMSLISNSVFIPRYYNPEILSRLEELQLTHDLVVLGDLKRNGCLLTDTGHEIGKMAYGTGDIPFIRTSDIVNSEIKADPKQGVSQEILSNFVDG